jgi:prevent-host-death family protein
MLPSVSATEARVRFGELLRRVVEDGETIVVERGGAPRAVVLSITAYEQMMAALRPEDWRAGLDRALSVGDRLAEGRGDRRVTAAEDVLHQVRTERDERFLDLR